MPRGMKVNLRGKTFACLRVLGKSTKKGGWWLCYCECGRWCEARTSGLRRGRKKSCGCLLKSRGGLTVGNPEYAIWRGMICRCQNPNNPSYRNYGGRGITVCRRWQQLENFLKDMGRRPSPQHQIDRIDNDGHYCPENCRWSPLKQQNRNKRNNHLLTYKRKTMCITEWAEVVGINPKTLESRINMLGWSVEKALTTPVAIRRG